MESQPLMTSAGARSHDPPSAAASATGSGGGIARRASSILTPSRVGGGGGGSIPPPGVARVRSGSGLLIPQRASVHAIPAIGMPAPFVIPPVPVHTQPAPYYNASTSTVYVPGRRANTRGLAPAGTVAAGGGSALLSMFQPQPQASSAGGYAQHAASGLDPLAGSRTPPPARALLRMNSNPSHTIGGFGPSPVAGFYSGGLVPPPRPAVFQTTTSTSTIGRSTGVFGAGGTIYQSSQHSMNQAGRAIFSGLSGESFPARSPAAASAPPPPLPISAPPNVAAPLSAGVALPPAIQAAANAPVSPHLHSHREAPAEEQQREEAERAQAAAEEHDRAERHATLMNERRSCWCFGWQRSMYEVMFLSDSMAGKAFDITMLVVVFASVLTALLESVPHYRAEYGLYFHWLELIFTAIFSAEYVLRIIAIGEPFRYMMSFFGIVDLITILPTYLEYTFDASIQTRAYRVIRAFRLMRLFIVFELGHYVVEAKIIGDALKASIRKVIIFLTTVVILVTCFGGVMYVVEGEENGFTSIPISIYYCIVTIATVGYGDLTPKTSLGMGLACVIMIVGYGILALPTGLVTTDVSQLSMMDTRVCEHCLLEGHDFDAIFCKHCACKLPGAVNVLQPPMQLPPTDHDHSPTNGDGDYQASDRRSGSGSGGESSNGSRSPRDGGGGGDDDADDANGGVTVIRGGGGDDDKQQLIPKQRSSKPPSSRAIAANDRRMKRSDSRSSSRADDIPLTATSHKSSRRHRRRREHESETAKGSDRPRTSRGVAIAAKPTHIQPKHSPPSGDDNSDSDYDAAEAAERVRLATEAADPQPVRITVSGSDHHSITTVASGDGSGSSGANSASQSTVSSHNSSAPAIGATISTAAAATAASRPALPTFSALTIPDDDADDASGGGDVFAVTPTVTGTNLAELARAAAASIAANKAATASTTPRGSSGSSVAPTPRSAAAAATAAAGPGAAAAELVAATPKTRNNKSAATPTAASGGKTPRLTYGKSLLRQPSNMRKTPSASDLRRSNSSNKLTSPASDKA